LQTFISLFPGNFDQFRFFHGLSAPYVVYYVKQSFWEVFVLRKKSFLFLLCFLLAFMAFPVPAGAAGFFSDVPPTAWYATDVLDLVSKGVIQGTGGNKFSPGDTLSRGAFVTMLCKTMLTAQEAKQYNFKGKFSDVPQGHWANPFVNWAVEAGVVSGRGNGTFGPNAPVTRQDMAVMVMNLIRATGRHLPAANPTAKFTDSGKISGYAAASVSACQQAGVINGYQDGSFGPLRTASRAEAASLYARFLRTWTAGRYEIIHKRVNGVAVKAVEFDPHDFSASVALGNGTITGRESPASIVSRSGAAIAINSVFFMMNSYMPLGTMVSDGRVLVIDNQFAPAKSAFVIDGSGSASIQSFKTWQSAVLRRKTDGGEAALDYIVVNQKPSQTDPTRVIFTRDWGQSLGFSVKDAVVVGPDGVVTQVLHNSDAAIPAGGYVLIQRINPWTGTGEFFETVQPGDTVETQRHFQGASTQDIRVSVGMGPRIVKDGAVYGNADTYAAEGFKDPSITQYEARRSCIGVKNDGKVVLLTTSANLSTLAKIMVSMGCRDAVNCDGGGSSNLYVDGQWLYGPQSRPLNQMLVFK